MSNDNATVDDKGRVDSFDQSVETPSSQRGRFQPGRSGNPKGRPRKRHTNQSAIQAALAEQVTIKDSEGTRKISASTAIAKRLVQKAIAGDIGAVKEIQRGSPAFLTEVKVAVGSKDNMREFVWHITEEMSESALTEFRNAMASWEKKKRRLMT